MKNEKVYNLFIEFEEKNDLFDLTPEDTPVWERIRFKVYREIRRKMSLIDKPHTTTSNSTLSPLRTLFLWAKHGLLYNPCFSHEHRYLFVGHGPRRRKLLDDGYWWNIYCDPIYLEKDIDALHLEPSHNLSKERPPPTLNIKYLDFIRFTGDIREKIGLVESKLTNQEEKIFKKASDNLFEIFDVEIDLIRHVKEKLRSRKARIDLFERVLEKVDPEVVIVVVSYGRETLIEACKHKNIPVVELQHGVIHEKHLAYHYPGDRDKKYFPDYLFTFGEYWNKAADFPIPDENVIPVGYPYLEMKSKEYESVPTKDQVLFISQGTIGKELSKVAVELAEMEPGMDIVYKLHPGEYARLRDEYPWLEEADLKVVDDDSIPLYRLFAESKVQVGVGSTAIFEGLGFGLDTYLFELPGIGVMNHLIERGYATVVDSPEALSEAIEDPSQKEVDTSEFFKPDAVENIVEELKRIRAEED